MDFYRIRHKELKGVMQAYPDWDVTYTQDLMTRGGAFYAIWDEGKQLWSTDEFDVQRLVDKELYEYVEEKEKKGLIYEALPTRNYSTGVWEKFKRYVRSLPENNYVPLDDRLTFADTVIKKTDYVSRRLPYALKKGKTDAWDELVGVLYSEEERAKIEWAIGAIVSGDSKWIQKFLVLYGAPGTGKSTIMNVVEKLFEGYVTTFEAKALTSNNGTFAMESFRNNPLVAIQHDGDLSKISDNSKLNSIVGHDMMTINVKYQSSYTIRLNAFVFMGTNKPVMITDAKAGTVRRLIDVHPTGVKIEPGRYHILVEQINFELGAIAYKCLDAYKKMGKHYYENYVPKTMMALTDTFYNFVEANYDIFKQQDGVQLKQAWAMYKEYCEEANIKFRLQYHEVRDELGNYFKEYKDRYVVDDKDVRSYYAGFKGLPEQGPTPFVPDTSYTIDLNEFDSIYNDSAFNRLYSEQLAQYAKQSGFPGKKWDVVSSQLKNIDTKKLHYVKVPTEHIVIDFDLTDEDGIKDIERNLEEASKWPPTYTELSKSGAGVHLHYIYEGDVHELANIYDVGIEVKTLLGDSSLRRKLTQCNTLDIATISSGLPKKEKKMLDDKSIKSEKGLRDLIERNLRKEIHPGTKPSVDFIHSILEDAYADNLSYDIRDMRPKILAFAAKSTNQSNNCIKLVQSMRFVGQENMPPPENIDDAPIIFFDVEVYKNLFVVCWKKEDSDEVVRMINPKPHDIEPLLSQKLVGFNNRRYDNHILYARYLGHSVPALYSLSQKLIANNKNAAFGEAYNLSYADIYDFSSKKQGLKKFMIELGIFHLEMDIPWDEPVPQDQVERVVEYCVNDVIATEAVFKSRKQDFIARQILAEISGLSVNHTTQAHTAKIIFGNDKHPQSLFVYTDLAEEFKGYTYGPVKNAAGKETWGSLYRGEVVGEGGYVYAEPGAYENVALLDIASMHPTTIEILNLFGPFTEKFSELKTARMAIKHKEYEKARSLLDNKLAKHLENAEDDPVSVEALSYALKIVINIVYGLTSARFENQFKDNRNKDNIVAKRGALFMVDLKHAVQEKGFTVAHIKTDSIKIPDATQEIIDFVFEFGKKYGYDFEHENTYERLCLVNDAVYIARAGDKWTAVGKQFQHPYVFKTLFSKEVVNFDDLCETKHVTQGAIYLDTSGTGEIENMVHVGRTGSFVPVKHGGGVLWRIKDDKSYAVTGTKGYHWVTRDVALAREAEDDLHIDMEYFAKLENDAKKAIEEFIPFDAFVE